MDRTRTLKLFLYTAATALLFWWPLSHWFYSDWYHTLLGFEPGTYPDGMVKMIGTCGIFPVTLAFLAARNPAANRTAVITLIFGAAVLGLTFVHLIAAGHFPQREYANVALCFLTAGFLALLYPWQGKRPYKQPLKKRC